MKKPALTFIIVICTGLSAAQGNFILAGQTDSMTYSLYRPSAFALQAGQYGNGGENQVGIDLNHDGVDDFTIILSQSVLGVGSFESTMLLSMQPNCFVYCALDTYRVVPIPNDTLPFRDSTWHPIVRNFSKNDTSPILTDTLWRSGSVVVADNNDILMGDNSHYLSDTSKLTETGEYHFFKLIIDQDTLYAYARFSQISDNNTGGIVAYIYDFACEGVQLTETLQTTIRRIPVEKNISIFPLPFNRVLNIISALQMTYSLYTAKGCLVLAGTGNYINTESISPGAYILVLESENAVIRKSVVKVR